MFGYYLVPFDIFRNGFDFEKTLYKNFARKPCIKMEPKSHMWQSVLITNNLENNKVNTTNGFGEEKARTEDSLWNK